MSISENIIKIKATIPEGVKLVAVSKTKPNMAIMEAYNAGQRIFGENKVQDLAEKYATLPKDIQWHYIGHLQTNKVKFLAPFVNLIEAVDSIRLLKNINKEAAKHNRKIDCLLQFHIAEEDTKFGLSLEEAKQILESADYKMLENVRIVGVMGMATYTDDESHVKREFASLNKIFQKVKSDYFLSEPSFKEISMGMSGDYPLAIEEGATMVRVGTAIFGNRNY